MSRARALFARRAARLGAVGACFAAAPAFAQRLGQGMGTEVPVWRVILALAFCLALGAAAIFVLRRRFKGARPLAFGRDRRLVLVESLRLGHQVDLCIVSRDGHEYLIAAGPHGAALIDGGPLPTPVPDPADARE